MATVLVDHIDGTQTTYNAASNTDGARWTALSNALSAATAYDVFHIGPGTFENSSGDGPTIATDHLTLIGSGSAQTILKNSDGNNAHSTLRLSASNLEFQNLQILSTGGKALSDSNTSTPLDNLRFLNCIVNGRADTFVAGASNNSVMNFFSSNSQWLGSYDGFYGTYSGTFANCLISFYATPGNNDPLRIFRPRVTTWNLIGCQVEAITDDTGGYANCWYCSGSNASTLNAWATTFTNIRTSNDSQAGDIRAFIMNAQSTVNLYAGCKIVTSSASSGDTGLVFDIDNSAGGTVNVDPTVAGSGTNGALVLSGNVSYAPLYGIIKRV